MADNVGELVGMVANGLMEQAQSIENPAIKEGTERIAQRIDEQERQALVDAARQAPFCRLADWMAYLELTSTEQKVLAKIFSYQCAGNEYRVSLANAAVELGLCDRFYARKVLKDLVSRGYLIKKSNGKQRPATYLVDEVRCMSMAIGNGYNIKIK